MMESTFDLDAQHAAFEDTYRKLGNPDYVDEFESNIEMGHRLIDDYAKRDYVLDDFHPVQVESQFKVRIGDKCPSCTGSLAEVPIHIDRCPLCDEELYMLVGRSDLIVKRGSRLVGMDHKSAKGVGKNTMTGWSHDFGLIGYAYGVTKSTPFKVTQFGVNIIKKLKTVGKDTKVCPACRNGKRKRLTCDECDRTGKVPMDPPKAFYRDYFRITDQDYKGLEINRTRLCDDILRERELYREDPLSAYPMNCKSCESYSGCPYVDICWEGNPDGKWWDIPQSTLADFHERDPDYVDGMITEELE
jgi:hypothetical protein